MKDPNIKSVHESLQAMIETDSYQLFETEGHKYIEEWQYWEPRSLEFADRFEFDKEAYLEQYFPPEHLGADTYDESILLERLISNLAAAKHPYWIGYREFLKKGVKNNVLYHFAKKKTKKIIK